VRPGLSLGFFGWFGRSPALRELDGALRSVDLHPNLVPEAVKLTAVRMLMDHEGRNHLGVEASRKAAEILAYCMIGAEAFAGANGVSLAEDVEQRIDAALATGTSLDARLVLLALHAKVIQPSVVDHFGLESDVD
jgi:small nuclear ribonucleoprotein (snRNP)-like protein